VSGIDVDRVKTTPFGQFFLSQLPATDSGFNEFVTATGFDPRRDVREIVMASPADTETKAGLLLMRGAFDTQRILSLLKAVGKTPETYHGVAIISRAESGQTISHALALLDDSTVVAGDLESVRGAIDRRSASPGLDAVLADTISPTSAN